MSSGSSEPAVRGSRFVAFSPARVWALATATVTRLEELGEQLDGGNPRVRSRRVDGRPVAGTKLIREWQGTAHEVIIHVDHFEYEGRPYKSLSHIAKHITGTVWNGWAFFGLRKVGGLA